MKASIPARWSTASFGHDANTSPVELTVLADHLNLCRESRGRLFVLECAADYLSGLVVGRCVTTLMVLAAVVAVASLLS